MIRQDCPIFLLLSSADLYLTCLSYASCRLDNSLVSHLGLPSQDLLSYAANYSDDSKTWRPVEISRLVSKYQSEISDRRICASASGPKTCSIERILRKTRRFQKWLQAKRLTPDLVQVSAGHGWNEGWQETFTHTSHFIPQNTEALKLVGYHPFGG